MKKQFTKLLVLFALLLTVSTTAWADEVTYVFTSKSWAATVNNSAANWTSGQDGGQLTQGQGIQVTTSASGANGTSPESFSNISKIVVRYCTNASKGVGAIKVQVGSGEEKSFSVTKPSSGTGTTLKDAEFTFDTPETGAVKITAECTTNSVYIYSVTITYTPSGGGGGSETQKCATPTFSPAAGTYIGARSVELSTETEDATIYYTLNGDEPTTESTEYTGSLTINETTTVKAIAVKEGMDNSAVASATYTILEHAGTEADPYTVADAFTAINANVGMTGVYVQGIVSEIVTAFNSQYGNISYNISADGETTGDQLQAFRGKSYNGVNFTSEDDIQVGDEVVIYGNLKKYNDTYEFDSNNQLVSLVRPTAPVVPSVTAETYEVNVDAAEHEGSIAITYNNITEVVAQILTVDADGKEATYDWITTDLDANKNISYSIGKNDTGAARTAYLKVRVNDVYSNLITINQAKAPEQFTVTYYVAGEEFTTTRQEGAALNLTAPGARGGYQFAGWSTANDAAAPQFMANDAAVNSPLTLYAIFAKEVGETVYTKVTDTEDITDGKYLIVYEDEDGNVAFNGALETLDAVGNTIEVEISDNTIASSEAVDAATFTIDTTAGTIQSASGLYIGNTSNSNALEASEETAYTNALSIDDNGNAVVLSSGGAYLRYNSASNQLRFRYYKSASYASQKAIQLYKQTASATYTLNEPEATITAAANATWVAPAKVKITSTDVKVYTVTYDDAVGCTRKHEVADKVVPANGVVLLTSDDATTVTLENTADPATDYEALEAAHKNDLQGSDGNVQGGANIFCLADGDNGLGFYPVSDKICVPAGKAYLEIPTTQAAPSYIWFNGDTTAIDSLTTDTAAGNESGEIYSLTGQRVGKNYRGIVIMNGRKVLKK